jgi:dolichol-phosphate mannosyltransferase
MLKAVVIIPTYNEIDNISITIEKVLSLGENFDILVVDDNSPDGTAEIVKGFVSKHSNRVFLEIKNIKEGLGKAYTLGFNWAMARNL